MANCISFVHFHMNRSSGTDHGGNQRNTFKLQGEIFYKCLLIYECIKAKTYVAYTTCMYMYV